MTSDFDDEGFSSRRHRRIAKENAGTQDEGNSPTSGTLRTNPAPSVSASASGPPASDRAAQRAKARRAARTQESGNGGTAQDQPTRRGNQSERSTGASPLAPSEAPSATSAQRAASTGAGGASRRSRRGGAGAPPTALSSGAQTSGSLGSTSAAAFSLGGGADERQIPRIDEDEPRSKAPWRAIVAAVAVVAMLVGWMAVQSDDEDALTLTNNPLPDVEPETPRQDDPQTEAEAREETATIMRTFGQGREAFFAVMDLMNPAAVAPAEPPVPPAEPPVEPPVEEPVQATPPADVPPAAAPVEVAAPQPAPPAPVTPEPAPTPAAPAPAPAEIAAPAPAPMEVQPQPEAQAVGEIAAPPLEAPPAPEAPAEADPSPEAVASPEPEPDPDPDPAPTSNGVWRPAPGSTWQIQLINGVDMNHAVDVYEISLHTTSSETITELHNRGHSVVCYFSAGTIENWRPDADTYPEWIKGNAVAGWPDERWIDIRAWDTVGPLMNNVMSLAKEKGCDGVDADNMNSYTHDTGFGLTAADQLVFNRRVADTAHAHGLGIGLKNNLGQIGELVGHFDWSINESCYNYSECHLLAPFAEQGKAIFAIMYGNIGHLCGDAQGHGISLIAKDRLLGAWRTSC